MQAAKILLTVAAVLVVLLLVVAGCSSFAYFYNVVDQNEIGVQFQGGQIIGVVGPGIYSDTGYRVDLKKINLSAIPFSAVDEEVLTQDKQAIGAEVSGDIFRTNSPEFIQAHWLRYNTYWLNDNIAQSKVSSLTKQSLKVCIGQKTFDANVIGAGRDELRVCVAQELNDLVSPLGLTTENVAIPNIIVSEQVRAQLEAIRQITIDKEKAVQDKLKIEAQALAEQARQEAEIAIAQSRIQEEARQQTTLAALEAAKVSAQKELVLAKREIIVEERENDRTAAELEVEVARLEQEAAMIQAETANAKERVLAEIYNSNPEYVKFLVAAQNAKGLSNNSKVIFTPQGTVPNVVMSEGGVTPIVSTQPVPQPNQ